MQAGAPAQEQQGVPGAAVVPGRHQVRGEWVALRGRALGLLVNEADVRHGPPAARVAAGAVQAVQAVNATLVLHVLQRALKGPHYPKLEEGGQQHRQEGGRGRRGRGRTGPGQKKKEIKTTQ